MVKQTTSSIRKTRSAQRGYARAMRGRPMDAEQKFWWRVRDRRLDGHKFKRQFLVGKYIVDFVCLDKQRVIELDGGQHALRVAYDNAREAFLKARGFRVMRFWNDEVLKNMEGVLEGVLMALAPSPQPSPPMGERGKVI